MGLLNWLFGKEVDEDTKWKHHPNLMALVERNKLGTDLNKTNLRHISELYKRAIDMDIGLEHISIPEGKLEIYRQLASVYPHLISENPLCYKDMPIIEMDLSGRLEEIFRGNKKKAIQGEKNNG